MSTVYEIVKTLYTFEMPYNGQGNRIKIQTYYECRRRDTPAKPRVEWGQSPKWNPGKTANNKIKSSVGAALTVRALGLGKCRPFGAQ